MSRNRRTAKSFSRLYKILTSPAALISEKLGFVILLAGMVICFVLAVPFAGTSLVETLVSLDGSGLVLALVFSALLVLVSVPVAYSWIVNPYVTAHTTTEAALRESEALLRQAIRMGRMGHWEWDARTQTYITCSEELAQLYGFTVDEYLKAYDELDSVLDDVYPGDHAAYGEAIRASEENVDSYEVEFRETTASGEFRYFREYGEPVYDADSRPLWTMGILQDITERKQAEAALEDSKRALEARIVELEEVQDKLELQGAELVRVAEDLKVARDQAEAAKGNF